MSVPPHSAEAETSVLGTVLLSDRAMGALVADLHLRPDQFYWPRNQAIYGAMVALFERSEPIDTTTLIVELSRRQEGPPVRDDYVAGLASMVPNPGNYRAYAERVIETAGLRDKQAAFRAGIEAVDREDRGAIADAEARLSASGAERSSALSPEGWAEALWGLLATEPEPTFPFPFEALNRFTHGGMRRKQVTLVGGWTNTGKSLLVDQILDSAAKDGARAHLYINEMGREDRGLRLVARKARVPYSRLVKGNFAKQESVGDEHHRVNQALADLRFGVTECAGWSAEEIAFDIRRHRWDVCALDILHRIGFHDERDIARASAALNDAAKIANCHLLIAVHLNEARAKEENSPRPVLRDIRASGALKNDADNVMFVYRPTIKNDEGGIEMDSSGEVFFAKVRSGAPGSVKVNFDMNRLEFRGVVAL